MSSKSENITVPVDWRRRLQVLLGAPNDEWTAVQELLDALGCTQFDHLAPLRSSDLDDIAPVLQRALLEEVKEYTQRGGTLDDGVQTMADLRRKLWNARQSNPGTVDNNDKDDKKDVANFLNSIHAWPNKALYELRLAKYANISINNSVLFDGLPCAKEHHQKREPLSRLLDCEERKNSRLTKTRRNRFMWLLVLLLNLFQRFGAALAFTNPSTVCLTQRLSTTIALQAERTQPNPWFQQQQQNNNNKPKDDPEWKFFDTARINVQAGDGGTGCVAFRREKGEPRGGPNGGRGGRGGSLYLQCDSSLNTLMPLRQKVHHRAKSGKNGLGKNKDGSAGNDVYIRVPMGTVVRDLYTQQLAGELSVDGETLLVAKGGRGGRGNAAFMTSRRTAPKLAERGEPGSAHWLSVELRLVADVGFLGLPNAGKSTLLAAASNAKPKIANYPFTTIVPNLGVCDIGDQGAGLVLCDIPGLIEGASSGAGMGGAFLRHVQRCRVLLHVVDGTSHDPIEDFRIINEELRRHDPILADKPQVVVLNKIDIPEVADKAEELVAQLKKAAGHSRVLSISAATTERVKELMGRLKKFVVVQPEPDLPPPPEIDLSKAGLDYDSDDFEVQSDPSYPGQWRVKGRHVEQIARMTHWEYPEAVERFGMQLQALGIADELVRRGAQDGDLVMVDEFDFDFSPGLTNPYIPPELLEQDEFFASKEKDEEEVEQPWRPFQEGGYMDVDSEEFVGFGELGDWDLLENDVAFDNEAEFAFDDDDEIWTS